MSELFQGKFESKIDKKGRVSIPASFRRVLCEGDPKNEKAVARFSILQRPGKPFLEVYSVKGMEEIAERINRYPPASPKREALSYLFLTNSIQLQLDEAGRVVISDKLREAIGVEEDIVFVGSIGKFEIWELEALKRNEAEKLALLEAEGLLDAPFGDMVEL